MTTSSNTPRKPSSGLSPILIVVAALALVAGALAATWLKAPTGPASVQSGTLLKSPRALPSFSLTDEAGQPYTNRDLEGRWTLVFPGFTYCPDVCPTTLGLLKNVEVGLGSRAERLQIVLLSVDPARDTAPTLERYVHFFSPRFKGVTTTEPALRELAQALGVAYVKVPGETPDSYTMDHSSALVLINPRGELAGYFTPPLQVDALVRDLGRIVGRSS